MKIILVLCCLVPLAISTSAAKTRTTVKPKKSAIFGHYFYSSGNNMPIYNSHGYQTYHSQGGGIGYNRPGNGNNNQGYNSNGGGMGYRYHGLGFNGNGGSNGYNNNNNQGYNNNNQGYNNNNQGYSSNNNNNNNNQGYSNNNNQGYNSNNNIHGYGNHHGYNNGGGYHNRNQGYRFCPNQTLYDDIYRWSGLATGYPVNDITNELTNRPDLTQCLARTATPDTAPSLPTADPMLGHVKDTCNKTLSRLYSYFSNNPLNTGRCWVLQNFQETVFFATCQNYYCQLCQQNSRKQYEARCIKTHRYVGVYAYCENNALNARIVYERIIIPDNCICQAVYCYTDWQR